MDDYQIKKGNQLHVLFDHWLSGAQQPERQALDYLQS